MQHLPKTLVALRRSRRTENQKDFQVRMKQFFDHYLMDKPEPKWMSDGVPQVDKGVE